MSLATRIAQEINTVKDEATATSLDTVHTNGSGLSNELSTANSGQVFKVADGVASDDAVSKGQLDTKMSLTTKMSLATSNVLVNSSSLAIANFAVTKNFATVTYTGNGTTQNIITDINSVDFTVSSNGSGYWHDRTTGDCIVKDDTGTIHTSGSAVVNTSKVHIKKRNASANNNVFDGLRGVSKYIQTSSTNVENSTSTAITAFTALGFNIGSGFTNDNSSTYVDYQTLYTHIRWGLTNQASKTLRASNPVTREFNILIEGGIGAGEKILTDIGAKADYFEVKDLDGTSDGKVYYGDNDYNLELYSSNGAVGKQSNPNWVTVDDEGITFNTAISGGTILITGKAKSKTFIIREVQTSSTEDVTVYDYEGNYLCELDGSVFGNTRQLVMAQLNNGQLVTLTTKRIDSTGSWALRDYVRGIDKFIRINDSAIEATSASILSPIMSTTDSFFDLPTDNTNLNVTNGDFFYTNGRDENGYALSSERVNGTIDFTGVSDGLRWVAKAEGGSYSFYDNKPLVVDEIPSGAILQIQFNPSNGKTYGLDGLEITTPISFLKSPVMVVSETPIDIRDEFKLPDNIMTTLQVERVIQTDIRKMVEIGTVFNDNRYVIDIVDIFPDYQGNYLDYEAKCYIKEEGVTDWFEVGQARNGTTDDYGVLCGTHIDGIVVQTASNYVAGNTPSTLDLNTDDPSSPLTSALAMVVVTYIGETK